MHGCLEGDHAAWDELCVRFSRLVYSIPRRYGFTDAESEDLTQIVFIRLFEKLDTLKDEARLAAWLSTTTHRLCWRRRPIRDGAPLDLDIVDVGRPADEQLVEWERQHLLHEGLRHLGDRCRELLSALYLAPTSPSYQSVAARLGISVGSIGSIRARCFAQLRDILVRLGLEIDGPSVETAESSINDRES